MLFFQKFKLDELLHVMNSYTVPACSMWCRSCQHRAVCRPTRSHLLCTSAYPQLQSGRAPRCHPNCTAHCHRPILARPGQESVGEAQICTLHHHKQVHQLPTWGNHCSAASEHFLTGATALVRCRSYCQSHASTVRGSTLPSPGHQEPDCPAGHWWCTSLDSPRPWFGVWQCAVWWCHGARAWGAGSVWRVALSAGFRTFGCCSWPSVAAAANSREISNQSRFWILSVWNYVASMRYTCCSLWVAFVCCTIGHEDSHIMWSFKFENKLAGRGCMHWFALQHEVNMSCLGPTPS